MAYVWDASATLSWIYKEKNGINMDTFQNHLLSEDIFVPSLWFYEILNSLTLSRKAGRISPEDCKEYLNLLADMDIDVVSEHDLDAHGIQTLALKHSLTAYDATYLWVAKAKKACLVSLDKSLRKAAGPEKLKLLPEKL